MRSVELFAVPAGGRKLVWAPLRGVAFVGNDSLVSLLGQLAEDVPPATPTQAQLDAIDFIRATGVLDPAPRPHELGSTSRYLPTHATLFMTTRCNLRCTYCYADAGGASASAPAREMSPALAAAAVDVVAANAREVGRPQFSVGLHGGGEPTLNVPAMRAAIERARAADLPCHVTASSNGAWSAATRDFVLEHFDALSLSFDGLPELQDAQRPLADGSGSHALVMRNVEALDAAGFEYGVRTTVTRETAPLLPAAIDYITTHCRPKTLQVEPAFPRGRGLGHELTPADTDAFVAAFEEAWRIADDRGFPLLYSGARIGAPTTRFCQATTDALVVMQSGDVTCCFEVHDTAHPLARELVFGSLAEDGRLDIDEDRWRGLVARTSADVGHCADCFCRFHCQGDCLGRTYCAGGEDRFAPSVRCDINRRITTFLLLKKVERAGGVWIAAAEDTARVAVGKGSAMGPDARSVAEREAGEDVVEA